MITAKQLAAWATSKVPTNEALAGITPESRLENAIEAQGDEHRAKLEALRESYEDANARGGEANERLQRQLREAEDANVMSAALVERLRGELAECEAALKLGREGIQAYCDSENAMREKLAEARGQWMCSAGHRHGPHDVCNNPFPPAPPPAESTPARVPDFGAIEWPEGCAQEGCGHSIDAHASCGRCQADDCECDMGYIAPAESTPVQRIVMKETSWGGRYAVTQCEPLAVPADCGRCLDRARCIRNDKCADWDDIQGLPAHLRDDAPHWQCSGCGRKSWAAREVGRVCAMPQPNGQTCTGRFLAPQPAPLFDTSAPPKLHAGFALCAAVDCLDASIMGIRHAHGPGGRVQVLRDPPAQPAPTLSTFNQVMAALRNPAVNLGDLDVCKACLSVESPYLHSVGTPCPTGPTVDIPQPAPSAITVKVVVNGHPTEVSVEPRCTMRRLVELAIEKTGMIGRPIDDWRVRDDEGYEYPLDEWKISPQFPPDTKLWLFLGVGKCSAAQPAPSGDEAKVREIADDIYRRLWKGDHDPLVQHTLLPAAVAAGRTLGREDASKECEGIAVEEMCGSKRTLSERLTGKRIVEAIRALRGRG